MTVWLALGAQPRPVIAQRLSNSSVKPSAIIILDLGAGFQVRAGQLTALILRAATGLCLSVEQRVPSDRSSLSLSVQPLTRNGL